VENKRKCIACMLSECSQASDNEGTSAVNVHTATQVLLIIRGSTSRQWCSPRHESACMLRFRPERHQYSDVCLSMGRGGMLVSKVDGTSSDE
jgi:hypothetical protein